LEIFNHLLDTDGQKALHIVYDPELKEYHDNAHAYLRYKLTDITIDLNCFCGINIESELDFKILKNMIESWDKQYLKIPLHLSIYSDKIDKEIIMAMEVDKLNIYYSKEALSQFEHYKNILYNYGISSENAWCMFSNYNDIWMKQRSIIFNILINLYNTSIFDKKPLYVKYNYVSENNKQKDIVQYGCKFKDLKNFVYNSNIKIINHDFCKYYFIKYLSLNDGICLAFPDGELFKIIYNNTGDGDATYNNKDLMTMMILYFSKRISFNVIDFENFWNCFVKNIAFGMVKKNSIVMYNNNDDLKIFQNSLLII